MHSFKNHIYWTAASSITGPERMGKWTSILIYVQDEHTHEDLNFQLVYMHKEKAETGANGFLQAGESSGKFWKVLSF